MRAIQLLRPTQVELTDVETPEISREQVLLRVTAAGVCQTDVHIRHVSEDFVPAGSVLGHEIAGVVSRVGEAVHGWAEGDAAVVYPVWSCGVCTACRQGRQNACRNTGSRLAPAATPGVSTNGGMADYVAVPASALVPIGDLDPAVAASLSDAGLAPYHSVRALRDQLVPGTTAVVIGAGGLGQMAVQLLRTTTDARVVVLDRNDDALEAVREHADLALRSDDAATLDRILELTDGYGAEAVLDFVGVQATLELAANVVAPGGAIRLIGLGGGAFSIPADAAGGGFPWGVSVTRPYSGTYTDLVELVALARAGRIVPSIERFSLDQGLEVLDKLEAGEIRGRAVLIPGDAG